MFVSFINDKEVRNYNAGKVKKGKNAGIRQLDDTVRNGAYNGRKVLF